MTRARTNVVPFERPAAYWAGKARRHYTPAQLPDAARMMRKALEKSGDSSLALELSEIYAGMGCFTAAERCLIRVSARQGLTGSLCYAIACCALNRGQEDLADEALDQCLRLEPEGPYSEQAQDLLEMYPWKQSWPPPHCARSDALRRRSIRLLGQGRLEEATETAKRAWAKGASPQAGLWLGMLLPPREALPYLKKAAEGLPKEFRAQLEYARACHAARRYPQARRQLQKARALCRTISDAEICCAAAWDMNRPREALRLAEDHLREMPASVDYLRLKYLSLRRMGDQEQARRALEALLEIDPDDADGIFDRRHPGQAMLHPDRAMLLAALGSLVYALPRHSHPSPLNRALHLMVMTLNGAVSAEAVYALLPGLWRRLTPAERLACDERREDCFPLVFSAYLLAATGQWTQARQALLAARHRKRILRLLIRLTRRMNRDALHQL